MTFRPYPQVKTPGQNLRGLRFGAVTRPVDMLRLGIEDAPVIISIVTHIWHASKADQHIVNMADNSPVINEIYLIDATEKFAGLGRRRVSLSWGHQFAFITHLSYRSRRGTQRERDDVRIAEKRESKPIE